MIKLELLEESHLNMERTCMGHAVITMLKEAETERLTIINNKMVTLYSNNLSPVIWLMQCICLKGHLQKKCCIIIRVGNDENVTLYIY